MHKKALEIAKEHFQRVNPAMWDGNGVPPTVFVNHRITYSLNKYTELDVSFERDSTDGWRHCCKLRDTKTNNVVAIQYGSGINSPQRLVDTILQICKKIGGIHMDYTHLKRVFQKLKHSSPSEDLTAHIIFTEDSFTKPYPLLSRTYSFSSDNKAFYPGMGGYSIFAYCLDGTDQGVRLDWLMAEEGNPDGWKAADCYVLEQMWDAEAIFDLTEMELEDKSICYSFGGTCIRAYQISEGGKIRLEPLAGNQVIDGKWAELSIDRVYGDCTLLTRHLNGRMES